MNDDDVLEWGRTMSIRMLETGITALQKAKNIDEIYTTVFGYSQTAMWTLKKMEPYISDPEMVKRTCDLIENTVKKGS